MQGSVEQVYDGQKRRVEYRLVVQGTLGIPPVVEEVDYLRDRPLETRVTNIQGEREQVRLCLEGMAEELVVVVEEGKKLLKLNAAFYQQLIDQGEIYARNGTYSLRLTMS